MSITTIRPRFQGLALYVSQNSDRVGWAAFSGKGHKLGRDEVQLTVLNMNTEDLFSPSRPTSLSYTVARLPEVGALADLLDNPATQADPESRAAAVKALEAVDRHAIDAGSVSGRTWKDISPQNALRWMRGGLQKTIKAARTEPLTHQARVTLQGLRGEELVGEVSDGRLVRAMRESRFYERRNTWPEIYVDTRQDEILRPNAEGLSGAAQWWRHLRRATPAIKAMPEAMKSWSRAELRSASLGPQPD